jgi:hypothetical protein
VTSGLTTLGPPLGGILAEAAGWRALFLINVPLVIAALFATRQMMESREESATGKFDWLGAVVAVLAVGGLAFGLTRGQQQRWQDPVAFASLAIGGIALVAFPFLMRRPNPLVPLGLFRIRSFSTINLATLLIYGALYASGGFQALFLQNTLGYTPLGAAIVGLPSGILLTILSTRVGSLSGRLGVRPFLIAGPLVMAAGSLWWLTVQSTAKPWAASLGNPASLVPPIDALIGPLPAGIIFGIGISLLVAPLTTALMGSVPVRNSGIASAINNALSRVGQPLVAAAVFIAVSGTFYAALASAVPGTDPNAPELRAYDALNPPPKGAPVELVEATKVASTAAYHTAVIVSALLLVAGAVVNAVGLRQPGRGRAPSAERAPPS